MPFSHSPSRLSVMFDDDHAVADAGLALVGVLSETLGLEALAEELVDVHPFPGRRVATLVHAMVAGADCIDDADLLRSGSTSGVLAHKVMAPSTLGTFLRAFSFGHVRQLDKISEAMLDPGVALGAGPGAEPMTIDLDSTICPVHGDHKQGAAFGYTHVLGYHPLVGTRAERARSSMSGSERDRPDRDGGRNASSESSSDVATRQGRPARSAFGPTRASTPPCHRGLPGPRGLLLDHRPAERRGQKGNRGDRRGAWDPIDYTDAGEAWVAETTYGDGHRLVVRRTKLADPQPALLPDFRYHAFHHRPCGRRRPPRRRPPASCCRRARDQGPEGGIGTFALPFWAFWSNGAWAVCATIAHNLIRWLGALGLQHPRPPRRQDDPAAFLSLPGRITRRHDDASSTCRRTGRGPSSGPLLRAPLRLRT